MIKCNEVEMTTITPIVGEWVDVVLRIDLQDAAKTGSVDLWMNNVLKMSVHDIYTSFNDTLPHYLKLGTFQQNWQSTQTTATQWFGMDFQEVRIGDSFMTYDEMFIGPPDPTSEPSHAPSRAPSRPPTVAPSRAPVVAVPTPPPTVKPACPTGYTHHGDRCYKFFPQYSSWHAARDYCTVTEAAAGAARSRTILGKKDHS
jgi:hypothetical protein